jgi:hypothetical protein
MSDDRNATTVIAARLSIPPGARLFFSPTEWLWMLGPLPPGVVVTGELAAATVAVVFVSNAASVRWFLDRHRTDIAMPRALWMCYPTRGRSDFNRGMLQAILAGHGLQPVREVTIDASWTALEVRHLVPGRRA